MDKSVQKLRSYLSAEGAEYFDDIVLMRKLGASPNIKAIGSMYSDLALHAEENGLDSAALVGRVHEISEYFIQLRGESSRAIVTAVTIMIKGIDDCCAKPLDATKDFLAKAHRAYSAEAKGWMMKIKEYGYNIIKDMNSMLLFDYSSTVTAMMETAAEHGKKMKVYIPESRALDGGRPFVKDALRLGHSPVFFPDAAMASFVKKTDIAFVGAETFFPDGSTANTAGSDLVAMLCFLFQKPFFVPTAMIKVNITGIEGHSKKELGRDLKEHIAVGWEEETKNKTDFICPDLSIVEPKYITGYITELGVIPPAAMFGVSREYIRSVEG